MGSKRVSRKASKRVSRGGQRPSQESESQSSFLRETPVSGIVPRFEIPGWSERYGVVAGITGRGSEPGRGFDLGLWSSEPVGDVMTRWLTFRREMADFRAVVLGNQVHGVEVMRVDGGRGWTQMEGIDGWITTQPGILLTVTIADCVPVYLLAPSRGVALLHAGWRGTAEGILRVGLERLRGETGCPVQEIVMHCGIGICGECYEVGSEVMRGCGVPAHGPGPWHIDLREQLVKQARVLGLDHVTTSAWCSAHDRPRFYSHRASHGMDGRMVAYVGMPAEQRGSGAPSH